MIGEAGSITTSSPTANQPIVVTLTNPLTDPVFAFTHTNNGGDPFVVRMIGETFDGNGDTTSFTIIFEEWEYLDGTHGATETVNWLAIESGLHNLPDGRTIEAGTATADHTDTAVSLTSSFTNTPVVLTSVLSNNDAVTVDSDPVNVTATGFDVSLQEEEAEDGIHGSETVGWIAIEPGGSTAGGSATVYSNVDSTVSILGLNAPFTNPVVLAETQTINGPDPATVIIDSQANGTVGVLVREETSDDTEITHTDEDVGIVAFEAGVIACFCAGTDIQTPVGGIPVEALRCGDTITVEDAATDQSQILQLFRRSLTCEDLRWNPKLYPVCITAGALGHNLPRRDLYVSQQHRMLVSSKITQRMFGTDGVLVPAIKLTRLPGIYVDKTVQEVTYFHILLDRHHVILAEGAPSESFFTGPEALKTLPPEARAEIDALFPDHSPFAARPFPKRKKQKRLIRRHLKNRKPLLEAFTD
jgi:hypothetical protein